MTLLWQQLDLLHGAVAELLERVALGDPRRHARAELAVHQPSAALEGIAGRLEALRERLKAGQAEAARQDGG